MPLMIAASLLLIAAQPGQVALPAPALTPTPVQSVVYAPPPAAVVQLPATSAPDGATVGQGDMLGDSVMILVELFVLAVVLESALALIFTWAPFRETFNGQGVKPLVSFAAALALTGLFHTEILAKVVESYGGRHDHASDFLGQLIDSMIIAGGSSGVHTMLQKLGIRLPNASDADVPRPPVTKAWLAVLLKRRQARGPVQVEIAAVGAPAAADPAAGPDAPLSAADPAPLWEVCGTISGNAHVSHAAQFFLRDYGRFPTAFGWPVEPGTSYLLRLTGFDAAGQPVESVPYGPLTLATGASVDIDLTL